MEQKDTIHCLEWCGEKEEKEEGSQPVAGCNRGNCKMRSHVLVQQTLLNLTVQDLLDTIILSQKLYDWICGHSRKKWQIRKCHFKITELS